MTISLVNERVSRYVGLDEWTVCSDSYGDHLVNVDEVINCMLVGWGDDWAVGDSDDSHVKCAVDVVCIESVWSDFEEWSFSPAPVDEISGLPPVGCKEGCCSAVAIGNFDCINLVESD